MTRGRCLYLAVALTLAAGLCGPMGTFWSYLQGEPFYRGKPASYWSRELGGWFEEKFCLMVGTGPDINDWSKIPPQWARPGAAWEYWVWYYLPRLRTYLPKEPPILEGDPAAFEVLRTLLSDSNPQVRRMAARGLGKMKAQATRAIPALLHRLEDEDAGIRDEARNALQAIDQATAAPAFNE